MPIPVISTRRRSPKQRAASRLRSAGGHWRWLIPVLAVAIALFWRVRVAVSNHRGEEGLQLETGSGALDSAPGKSSSDKSETPDPMGPELLTSAAADAAETWEEQAEQDDSDASEPESPTGIDSPHAEAARPAGEDASGTFRPARAATDDYGVTVTDDTPAGLAGSDGWVRGDGTASCPESHPIKGNATSRIYHRPGESSYEATIPELCFADEAGAAAAGFRPRAR